MKTSIDNISLLAAAVLLGVILVAGIRERIVNIPRWFSNPPASFAIIRQQADGAKRFWIPVQVLFSITLITAFITNWKQPDVRNMMWISTGFFVVVIVITASYFLAEVMNFSRMRADAPVTPDLLKRADRWYKTTVIRNILQGAAFIFMVVAAYKKFNG